MYLHVCITEQGLNTVLKHVFVHTYTRFEATAEQFKAPALNKPTIFHSSPTHKLSTFENTSIFILIHIKKSKEFTITTMLKISHKVFFVAEIKPLIKKYYCKDV